MGFDAFGLFRGWCRESPSCLEYVPTGAPVGPTDTRALTCSRCRCQPQQHHPTDAEGYDPHSAEQVALRRVFDERLQSPAEVSASRKARGDAAFRASNFRTAYEHYSAALAADPDSAPLLANRCQAYLKVGKAEFALADAERAIALAPDWPKGWYRLGTALAKLDRPAEAAEAFTKACGLDPGNREAALALQRARKSAEAAEQLAAELEKARKSTTRRQAYDAKSCAQFEAKERAKKRGVIKSFADWTEEHTAAFEHEYKATWTPPPGVQLITNTGGEADDDGPRIVDVTEELQAEAQAEAKAVQAAAGGGVAAAAAAAADGEGDGVNGVSGALVLEENTEGGTGHAAFGVVAGGRCLVLEENIEGGTGHALPGEGAFGVAGGGGLVLEENIEGGTGHALPGEGAFGVAGGGGLVLEDNDGAEEGGGGEAGDTGGGVAEGAGGGEAKDTGGGGDEEEDSEDDNYVSDSDESDDRPPEQFDLADTTIMLPPRNYTLVHEDGRLHKKDNFEPMSFGMQRVWNDRAPEPIWVQTKNARWWQSATEVVVIAYTVPKERMKAANLIVSLAPRQIHVSDRATGALYLHGETQERIDPSTSTWLTDGRYVTLTLSKANLQIYDAKKKGTDSDTHWHRLLTEDQYVERGMVDADYSDLPADMRHKKKMLEEERRAMKKVEEQTNECALCGKDVRFFCDCRSGDKDYERPLPEGWKDPRLGFVDPIFEGVKYDQSAVGQLEPKPPPQPAPYRGR